MVKTDIILPLGYRTEDIAEAIAVALPLGVEEVREPRLLRRTLCLDGSSPYYKCTAAFSASAEREAGLLKMRKRVFSYEHPTWCIPATSLDFRPVVVGAGPAGLFATLALAEAGCRPILLERGEPIEDRDRTVSAFRLTGALDPESNVQFGEGGAGAYSDGKLKVGSMDKYKMKVLEELVSAGAPEDILYSSTAHVGTDRLSCVVRALRERLISLGAEICFSSRLTELNTVDGVLRSVEYEAFGEPVIIPTRAVILAVGHSARDTVRMMYDRGLPAVPKGFGIGVRIEHSREHINKLVYRSHAESIRDAASYHLVTHLPSGRSVYSFCMCPGGTVVAAAAEQGGIVTNGMSEQARAGENSNAALLVSVTPSDFCGEGPLAGIELQRSIERRAYELSGGYRAPVESLGSFLDRTPPVLGAVRPSYPCGVITASLEDYLPSFITDSLRAAMPDFDAWLPGYADPDAVLTGPETRSTSPIRFLRSPISCEAEGFVGVFPAGEGAGYSGGIVSSATDGLRVAEALLGKFGR